MVREEAWHELAIPHHVIESHQIVIEFDISNPSAPAEFGLSADTRKLGVMVKEACISAPVLTWLGTGQDPLGSVFHRNGYFLRAIKRDAARKVDELINAGVYVELEKRGLIPKHEFLEIDHAKHSKIARTKGAPWYVSAHNYPIAALQDAASVWVSINETLLALNLRAAHTLIDGHYGNFAIFQAGRPRWVDIGSIAEPHDWFGFMQFLQCFYYPLEVIYRDPEKRDQVRKLMAKQPEGLSAGDVLSLSGHKPSFDQREFSGRDCRDRRAITIVVAKLRRGLDEMKVGNVSNFWSNYRTADELGMAWSGAYAPAHPDTRFGVVASLADDMQAASFIDIGANDGLFTILCARSGMAGIAVDTDDASINKLYSFLGEHPDIPVSVAHGSFMEAPYVADLVLCLALTHHLFLSQGLSFDDISRKLASMTRGQLITEFMPNGLGGTADIQTDYPNPLPSGYSLESFLKSLRKFFSIVEVIEYDRPVAPSRRVLIRCGL